MTVEEYWEENNILERSARDALPINWGCTEQNSDDPLDIWYNYIYSGSNPNTWFAEKKPLMEAILAKALELSNGRAYWTVLEKIFPVQVNWSKLTEDNYLELMCSK